ncbi:MAG: flagellar motor switch protein FliM [Planctomycetes bacterium]|nr:flagellar motor switch protein FliM [Planctomycetota bacterium]MBL7038130.1 flagellar motor switch protein FliM [Pirellulaceae bacterium]
MGKETLSQEEIACLLQGESSDEHRVIEETLTPDSREPAGQRAVTDIASPGEEEEQIAQLRELLEFFAHNLSEALSELLRAATRVEVGCIDRAAYGEFLMRLDAPTCLVSFCANDEHAPFALNVELSILFPMIERMLGGDLDTAATQQRPLTEIEKRLATRIVEMFLDELKGVWRQVDALGLEIASLESNPCLPGAQACAEPVAHIQFELSLGQARGTMSLAIPRSMADNCEPASGGARTRQTPSRDGQSKGAVRVAAVLAETKLAATDVKDLQVGDVIDTEKGTDDLLSVTMDGEPRFEAKPGILDGHKALRIEQPSVHETK